MLKPEVTTLCYIEKGDGYLMLHRIKKEEDVNAGKWIGVGGHFEDGESPEDCLLREVKEETGLHLLSYRLRGIITFVNTKYPTEIMFLYTADEYEGELKACDEGELRWIAKDEIFDLNLWEGDKIFLELLVKGEAFFTLKLIYDGDELVESSVRIG